LASDQDLLERIAAALLKGSFHEKVGIVLFFIQLTLGIYFVMFLHSN